MKGLVEAVKEQTAISVHNGKVFAAENARPIYQWQIGKYVAADEVHGPKLVLSGQFPGIVNIISVYTEKGGDISNKAKLEKQISDYLTWLRDDAGKLRLLGIEREGRRVLELPLESVYVPLEARHYRCSIGCIRAWPSPLMFEWTRYCPSADNWS